MERAISAVVMIGLVAMLAAGCAQESSDGGPGVGSGVGRVNNEQTGRAQKAAPGGAAGNYSNPHAQSPGTSGGTTAPSGSYGDTAGQNSAAPGGAHGNYSNPYNTDSSGR